ncbi:MAG: sulfatase-like hydrolase/transferase [Planctomycetota bacterium]|nr:sulfatase-like hydrolase/transferase [Planctomycetota bacterium]
MPARPNILFLLADQQRYDAAGFAGNPQVRTPHLDRLAEDGVRYTRAYCPYPVCTPSRYSLFSGRWVHQHGGYGNHVTLAPGVPTFPRALRQAGWRTAAVGKMHFTPTYLDVGLDRLTLAEQHGDGRFDDDYHRALRQAGLVDAIDLLDQRAEYRKRAPDWYWNSCGAGPSNLPEAWHTTTWIGDRALELLEGWQGGGNLAVVGFVKPHHPFDPPARWLNAYDPAKLDPLPGWTAEVPAHDAAKSAGYFPNRELTPERLRGVMAAYYATVSHLDEQAGRLIEALKRKGLYEDTLIVYTADHGEYLGYHHLLLKGNYPYEPLARVPLLVKYPGRAHAGERRELLASLIDLAPTILKQAGVEVPAGMGGLDLADSRALRETVFLEFDRGRYMARSERHKLILAREAEGCFFYDLERDPFELDNRYADPACQAGVARLREAVVRWRLFDAPLPAYLDERAPVVGGSNVPAPGFGHRKGQAEYYERACAEFLSAHPDGKPPSGAVQAD